MNEPRRCGTIARAFFTDRSKQIRDFLAFLDDQHGQVRGCFMWHFSNKQHIKMQIYKIIPQSTPNGDSSKFPPFKFFYG